MSGIQINPASFNRWHHAMYNLSNSCQIKKKRFFATKINQSYVDVWYIKYIVHTCNTFLADILIENIVYLTFF